MSDKLLLDDSGDYLLLGDSGDVLLLGGADATLVDTSVGSWRLALNGLRNLLADCPVFRTRTGAANRTEAKQHIYYYAAPMTRPNLRPLVVLANQTGQSFSIAGRTVSLVRGSGVAMLLVDNARFPRDYTASYLDFSDFAGQLDDEIRDLAGESYDDGASSYWSPSGSTMIMEPTRADEINKAADDYWYCATAWNSGVSP